MESVGIVLSESAEPFADFHPFVIDARPRNGRDPFVVLTAVLRRAIEQSQQRLVVITHMSDLMRELGVFTRMAIRVLALHAAIDHVKDAPRTLRRLHAHRLKQFPPALNPGMRNICGHADLAYVLFVGDQINPVYRRFRHWPFHANSGCTVYLARCLERIQFNEIRGMWTNINCEEQHIQQLLEFKPDLHVIALGKEASTGLRKLGVKPGAELPHPQFASRFLRKKMDYAEELRKALLGSKTHANLFEYE